MPRISKEMKNIVINYYRTLAYSDATIAALLGNMQNESTINAVAINKLAAKMESEDAVDK